MTHATLYTLPEPEVSPDRPSRILDAAERCFVRAGFHRTTMQDVAAEAGMSPGNLYRYFKSKDAMVAGLCERDRADIGRDFATMAGTRDFMADFLRLGRKHFEEEPREKAVLCLEIWAEATRNAAIGALNRDFERDVIGRLTELFRSAQERGAVSATIDPASVALVVATLANGLFVRRAVSADFDAARETGYLLALVKGLLDGSVPLAPPTAWGERPS